MLEPPPKIEAIWKKAGRDWTLEERVSVKTWLNSEPQLTQMRTFALRHLGKDATWEDAEDCWGDYNAPPGGAPLEPGKLDKTLDSYDPNRGKFPGYLCFCFKQFCRRWAEQNAPFGARRVQPPRDEEGERLELVLVDDRTPDADAAKKELYAALKDCIQRLKPRYKIPVTWHYFEGYSIAEIADKLGISENLVKQRLLRARQQLKKCLEKKGVRP